MKRMTTTLEKPPPLKVPILWESTPKAQRAAERMERLEKQLVEQQRKLSDLGKKKTKEHERAGYHPEPRNELDDEIDAATVQCDITLREKETLQNAIESNSRGWLENRIPEFPLRIHALRNKIENTKAGIADAVRRENYESAANLKRTLDRDQFELDIRTGKTEETGTLLSINHSIC
jgi:chromosome segregation ATPase